MSCSHLNLVTRSVLRACFNQFSSSSKIWLERQMRDPFVKNARVNSYRCRSAFKLLQLNDLVPGGLIQSGDNIIDCGAAPGSWTQVAVKLSGPTGRIIALDLEEFDEVPGAIILPRSDIRQVKQVVQLIRKSLGNDCGGVDLVMSDIAPSASGLAQLDHPRLIYLGECVLKLALHVSRPGASLVVKLWNCPEVDAFIKLVERFYIGPWNPADKDSSLLSRSVRIIKPAASRSDSAEIYICARGFSLPVSLDEKHPLN